VLGQYLGLLAILGTAIRLARPDCLLDDILRDIRLATKALMGLGESREGRGRPTVPPFDSPALT
jgi:hypothetical protein